MSNKPRLNKQRINNLRLICILLHPSICDILLQHCCTMKQMTELRSLIYFEVCYKLIIMSVRKKVHLLQKKKKPQQNMTNMLQDLWKKRRNIFSASLQYPQHKVFIPFLVFSKTARLNGGSVIDIKLFFNFYFRLAFETLFHLNKSCRQKRAHMSHMSHVNGNENCSANFWFKIFQYQIL
jgi:hypothetical protein